jgi:predicted acetyltransferase
MHFELRPITDAELVAFTEAEYAGFGERPSAAQHEGARNLIELDRTIAVFDAGSIVGTAGAFTFELTVPGPAQLPAAGVTAVTVLPTHRRKGLLTRMMRHQLDDVAERGEPIALLTASEGSIYGRFGYGPAIHFTVVELERSRSRLAAPAAVPGRLVLLDRDAAGKVLPPIWDAVRRRDVGQIGRGAAYWGEMLRDGGVLDHGEGTRFAVVHERAPGDADGYATYRIESRPDPATGGWRRFLSVREVVTADPRVRVALWQYLLGVDLVDVVRAYQPLDDPLRWRLTDSRQARVVKLADHIWARLVDVPAALAGRRYADRGRLVVEVRDAFRPSSGGTFELEAGPDGAACRRVHAEPDLRMDAADLGSAYLGGVRFGLLARAGRVTEETAGAVAAADRLFGVDPLPWCDSDF